MMTGGLVNEAEKQQKFVSKHPEKPIAQLFQCDGVCHGVCECVCVCCSLPVSPMSGLTSLCLFFFFLVFFFSLFLFLM